MSLYSLSVLRVSITEGDSVAWIVAPEEKPETAANQNRDYRNTKVCLLKHGENIVMSGRMI